MMRVKALVAFNAYGIEATSGQEVEIEDAAKLKSLERLGWIAPLEEEKKATKKAKEQ